ncbi:MULTISPECIES: IS110 family RNA-guided transposase [Streptococcus]|uniref:IS110 family transposase n=1 Tax=Streptococcus TaxID=1301 RepID=UPI0010ECD2A3|nr:IS110 family transposase [Streptococcus dysgalactiae]VTS18917.1 transposase [Streptococcus dysgalactiae subsp. equisimilis]VTS37348.1 transposase [Streptococcus dysgalactiae subsp. equisimilis]VTS43116.1 transposase [Streptococcus dysgalactiae subsp. equisimilis]VTS45792.1 transposase [Streptococcus dysgalactiae subsp. equisimilis]
MFYVGIDIAKTKHDLACINETGETVITNFRFANSYQGFHQLKLKLKQLSPITQDIHIALESTGHYNYNIVAFLRELGYTVFAYNPFIIKQFAKSQSLRKTKTDKKDALLIARKLRSDVTPEYYQTDKVMDELKELTRYQNRLIQSRSKCKNLYIRLLDIIFPEINSYVSNLHSHFVYELLTKYPSAQKIARARVSSLLKIKRLTADKAHQIQETAKQTIGNASSALSLELVQLIDSIQHYDKQINQTQEEINRLMTGLDSPITSIPGIGSRLGAIILAEIKTIYNFKNPNQLQAFAGLDPAIYQSGQMDNTGHMVKRGSSYLRYALIQAAKLISIYSPHFKTYLKLKISHGKHYNVAVTLIAKKLIRVIYHLLKTNQTFDEAKLR